MSILVGDVPTFTYLLTVDDLPASATVVLTLTAPDGTVSTPAVTNTVLGTYTASALVTQAGTWGYRWEASGAATDVETGSFGVGLSLVSLEQAKAYMGVTQNKHDDEIDRLCSAALGVVENMTGPALIRRQFTETLAGGRVLLLRHYPVVSVTSVASVVNGVVTVSPTPATVLDSEIGQVNSPLGYGTVQVTYTAGLEHVPDEAVDAALIYVSYKYRRNHGGSESYMPAGSDGGIAPPMGRKALHDQMRLALGGYVRGMSVA